MLGPHGFIDWMIAESSIFREILIEESEKFDHK